MLSVEECKRHLKQGIYTDQQIAEIRDALYQVASILIDGYIAQKKVSGISATTGSTEAEQTHKAA